MASCCCVVNFIVIFMSIFRLDSGWPGYNTRPLNMKRTCCLVGFAVYLLAMLLFLLGFGGPYWEYEESFIGKRNNGLWQACYRGECKAIDLIEQPGIGYFCSLFYHLNVTNKEIEEEEAFRPGRIQSTVDAVILFQHGFKPWQPWWCSPWWPLL